MVNGSWVTVQGYLPFLCGLVLICGVSFWDDVHSLPDSLRMAVQIISTLLMFWSVGLYAAFDSWWLIALVVVIALFFCVGATNKLYQLYGRHQRNHCCLQLCDAVANPTDEQVPWFYRRELLDCCHTGNSGIQYLQFQTQRKG